MANVSKGWGIGDTVWVTYPLPSSLYWTPQSRVVKMVDMETSTNEAVVYFTDGEKVQDGATVNVYTTQALAAKGVIDRAITAAAATVALDTTTTVASTSGQTAVALGRVT